MAHQLVRSTGTPDSRTCAAVRRRKSAAGRRPPREKKPKCNNPRTENNGACNAPKSAGENRPKLKSDADAHSMAAAVSTLASDAGTRYFQQMAISWSTRTRGSVQRIQI